MKNIKRFSPKKVLYPACGEHCISDKLGGNTTITYLDPCIESIKSLTDKVLELGLEESTEILDIPLGEYRERPDFDVIVLQNSHGISEDIGEFIKSGTIVIANNYFGCQDADFFSQGLTKIGAYMSGGLGMKLYGNKGNQCFGVQRYY